MAMLILAITLSGCGSSGNNSSSADEQAIQTVFSSIGMDSSSFFPSSMFATSIHTATLDPVGTFSWTTASFSATDYTQTLTGITFDSETTVHAAATFSISASYSIGGRAVDSETATWIDSGTPSLSGSG